MKYSQYALIFNEIFKDLKERSEKNSIESLLETRGYFSPSDEFISALSNAGFLWVENVGGRFRNVPPEFGLYSEKGRWLLEDRFIFPLKDILGNVVALCGWYPDDRKYITTPSAYFSKQAMFYGMELLGEKVRSNYCVLVEGIFDTIALRSLGLPVMGMYGVKSSEEKKTMLGQFMKVIGIPDNDKVGKRVLRNNEWGLSRGSSYLYWEEDVKDCDELVANYDNEELKGLLFESFGRKERFIKL